MPHVLSRRSFLLLPLSPLLARPGEAAPTGHLVRAYEAHVGVLFDLIRFALRGAITLDVDRAAGRYRVTLTAEGSGVSSRTEGAGVIRDGRFRPTEVQSVHTVRGRDNRTAIAYDYGRGVIDYRSVSHTLLLGRRRVAQDTLRLAPGQHVDDLFSAELNFVVNKVDVDPDGAYRITVVRRARPVDEGPDEVSAGVYRAELATLRFRVKPESSTGRLSAEIDLTGFSSWARADRPARVSFATDRHLESVESSLILGTRFTLRLADTS
jgi:hypothetical protein